ncbi:MAG: ABC transporter permease [Frankia sp.]|nr:ABC transporter permease [Frankia sp.]
MSTTEVAPGAPGTPGAAGSPSGPALGTSGGRPSGGADRYVVLAERLALPVAWLALIIIYSILRPDTFPTWTNISNILGGIQAVLFALALAALMPTMAGDFDLSLGGIMGLTAIFVGWLNTFQGVNIWLACLIGLVVALLCGAINAFLVVTCDSDALIITLGTGAIYLGIVFVIARGELITGIDRALSQATFTTRLAEIPLEFYYALALMLIIWAVSSFTPLGLRVLFVGKARDVARLSGIRVNRIRWGGFVLGGLLAGFAGVCLLGTTGTADPTGTAQYLLPAYAAVFLGATTIRPGRFNAIGTGVAVYFLATGVNGLQLLGQRSSVQQLFYGGALVAAVVLSRQLGRRH